MAKGNDAAKLMTKRSEFRIVLSDLEFEGPIDVLLGMIEQHKLDISLVSISKVTEPFLEYVRSIDMLDLERTADFIDVAATLLEMKSKKMLPRIESFMPEIVDTPEYVLLRRLEQYKLIKDAAEKVKPLEEYGRYFKEPDLSTMATKIVIKDMDVEALLNAFKNLLERTVTQRIKPVKVIALDRWTVAQKIVHIKEAVLQRKEVTFFELFDLDYSKSEIINTFLALLELMKEQFVRVRQDKIYENISIYLVESELEQSEENENGH